MADGAGIATARTDPIETPSTDLVGMVSEPDAQRQVSCSSSVASSSMKKLEGDLKVHAKELAGKLASHVVDRMHVFLEEVLLEALAGHVNGAMHDQSASLLVTFQEAELLGGCLSERATSKDKVAGHGCSKGLGIDARPSLLSAQSMASEVFVNRSECSESPLEPTASSKSIPVKSGSMSSSVYSLSSGMTGRADGQRQHSLISSMTGQYPGVSTSFVSAATNSRTLGQSSSEYTLKCGARKASIEVNVGSGSTSRSGSRHSTITDSSRQSIQKIGNDLSDLLLQGLLPKASRHSLGSTVRHSVGARQSCHSIGSRNSSTEKRKSESLMPSFGQAFAQPVGRLFSFKPSRLGSIASGSRSFAGQLSLPRTSSHASSENFDNMSQLRVRSSNMVLAGSLSSISGPDESGAVDSDQEDSAGASGGNMTEPLSWISLFFLRICGLLPWTSVWHETDRAICLRPCLWYQWLVLATAALGVVCCLQSFVDNQDEDSSHFDCNTNALLSDIPLTCGAFLGLLALSTHTGGRALVECFQLLHSYACFEEFDKPWLREVHWDLAVTLLLWIAAFFERLRGTNALQRLSDGEVDTWGTLRIITFATSSLILLILCASTLFCCRALTSTVDAFCSNIVAQETLDKAVPRWNVVQAMLRKASSAIQTCVFVLQATVLFTFLLSGLDVYAIVRKTQNQGCTNSLVPAALLILGVSRIFFKASEVTDKCTRVPSLVNACTFGGQDINEERLYVVQYVVHSDAGFYVFDIRVTSDLTLKFAYISVVAMFALGTHIVSAW